MGLEARLDGHDVWKKEFNGPRAPRTLDVNSMQVHLGGSRSATANGELAASIFQVKRGFLRHEKSQNLQF